MRKYSLLIFLILVVAVSLCTTNIIPPTPVDNETNGTEFVEVPTLYISESGNISRDICSAKGIEGEVIIFHSSGCGACGIAIPRMEELELELGLDFEFIKLAVPEENERMQELKIFPSFVPTVIIGCQVLVGVQPKETYKRVLIEEV